MTTIDVNSLLQQMRRMSVTSEMPSTRIETGSGSASAAPADFAALLKQSINSVAETQKTAGVMAASFERGDKNVDLAQVMLSIQKADLSLNTVNQVRNKLVDAYKDIMNMSM
jgi:flagellar hook-basal body complex protein FliE